MSFLGKFKNKQQESVPLGVNLEYSSFEAQKNVNTYQPPLVQSPPQASIYQAQASQAQRQKGRPGGGWDDDDSQPAQLAQTTNIPSFVTQETSIPVVIPNTQQQSFESDRKNFDKIQLSRVLSYSPNQVLNGHELEGQNYEYESNLVNEATKLGGVRLKQSEQVLKDFQIQAQNLQEQVVGSILLNRLRDEENWKIQARIVYAIGQISQNIKKYQKYFESNIGYFNINCTNTLLQQALDQCKSEIMGKPIIKTPDAQFEFIEPPKQTIQVPQQPILTNNILELEQEQVQGQVQKKNAFGFIKSKNQPIQSTAQTTDLLDEPVSNNVPVQQQQFDLLAQPVDQQKKPNAFGFLKKNTEQQQPQQNQQQQQQFTQPQQNQQQQQQYIQPQQNQQQQQQYIQPQQNQQQQQQYGQQQQNQLSQQQQLTQQQQSSLSNPYQQDLLSQQQILPTYQQPQNQTVQANNITSQQPAQKANAFGFLKKQAISQPQQPNPIQPSFAGVDLNLQVNTQQTFQNNNLYQQQYNPNQQYQQSSVSVQQSPIQLPYGNVNTVYQSPNQQNLVEQNLNQQYSMNQTYNSQPQNYSANPPYPNQPYANQSYQNQPYQNQTYQPNPNLIYSNKQTQNTPAAMNYQQFDLLGQNFNQNIKNDHNKQGQEKAKAKDESAFDFIKI